MNPTLLPSVPPAASATGQRFRLTASVVASYFKHRCDRLFRWNSVERPVRGKAGIGWNVPKNARAHSRPGIALLMEAGDLFETTHIDDIIAANGESKILTTGFDHEGSRRTVKDLPFDVFALAITTGDLPPFVAQLMIDLPLEQQESFLRSFGLDPSRVHLGIARPDLIEVHPPLHDGGPLRLRIVDFKGSQRARHEHFIQVAYYSYLLDHAVRSNGLTGVEVDISEAIIRARREDTEFDLAPYRLAVDDFLRNKVPALYATPADDAHFHVVEGCAMCEYMETCRQKADAGADLSRIPYMTSESKRRIRARGITTHRQLANIDDAAATALRSDGHDLLANLSRYIASAQSLEDGIPRGLEATTLLMPHREDIRIVLSAEQDAVTGTCFAIGMRTYEGWDEEKKKPIGSEHVFVAEKENGESTMLLEFLRTLNAMLRRIDAANRLVAAESIEEQREVVEAMRTLERYEHELAIFKQDNPRLVRSNPDFDALTAARDGLNEGIKKSKLALKEARNNAQFELRRRQKRLHFYVYDSFDLTVLKEAVERHLFTDDPPGLLAEMATLVRLFPPSSVLADADTFRTIPGTAVTKVLRTMVALPVPYLYDLKSVSQAYQPVDANGEERGWVFRPRYGFGWEQSNQVAFERINDVWRGQSFTDAKGTLAPEKILEGIHDTVRSKLRATDSVVQRLKADFGDRLLLRKEPFKLHEDFNPTDFKTLDALRVFTMLESSLSELDVKHMHTLPVGDREAKFCCIRGMRFLEEGDEGTIWFTFDRSSRDNKFDVGSYNLVLTPEDRPEVLIGDVDGKIFETGFKGRGDAFKATLVEYDMESDPPRVRLSPKSPDKLRAMISAGGTFVLDQLYADYTSRRVLETLAELQSDPEKGAHVHALVEGRRPHDWTRLVEDAEELELDLRDRISSVYHDPDKLLNEGQWRAWRGVFGEPMTLVWGPPGTGKTHTISHILIGYALASQMIGRPVRILVTAFTHHAIANVLRKTALLARHYGIDPNLLSIVKLEGSNADANKELPPSVDLVDEKLASAVLERPAPCVIVGGTVWGVHKGMSEHKTSIMPWFDVVLVDEASQMRLPDALIAICSAKPGANIILAGDDQQLPPIIHGVYPEEHEHMLSSVFAFVKEMITQANKETPGIEERTLFQLEENFRMNEPLTAYPRDILYRGRFFSTQPDIRIHTSTPIDATSVDAIDAMLHPDRPVVLCRYTPPRSYTARNPIESELAASMIDRLSRMLIDEKSGDVYTPKKFAEEGVGVLSPHRAQNAAIRMALESYGFGTEERPMPLVDTVEKLQGKERDVIVVSYGVADEEYAMAEAEFLLSRNRFNVAATRARHKLVLLCSDTLLEVVPSDRLVLLESMMLKEFRRYCASGDMRLPWRGSMGEVVLEVGWRGWKSEG